MFQGALHTLNPVQRVGDQIAEAIRLHSKGGAGDVSKRVGELLELVGLPARRARAYPHQLSGGQRQRVLIGLAVACEPRLLIADEPTTALDVMVQAQVLRLLEDLQRELGLAIIFITHDLSTLADICRRIAVMYAGRIVEEGPNDQVFADAAHPYTRALAAAFPVIGDPAFRMNPSGLPGDPPDPRAPAERLPVPPALPGGDRDLPATPRGAVAGRATCARPRASTCPARRWPRDGRRAAPRGARPPRAVSRARGRRRVPWTAWTSPMHEGEIVALVGESGCGKTTLARTIMGLQRPDVRRGALPRRAARYSSAGAARAPPPRADDLPGPDRRAERAPDALRGGGRGHPDPGARGRRGAARGRRARRAPGLRPPESFFTRYPYEISGGQRQRVIIAGRDGAEPEPARGRRAGVGPRRLGARRDPRADARPGAGGRGHASSWSRTTSGSPGTWPTAWP